jgi:hypothetical protein
LQKVVPFPTKVDSLKPNVFDQLKNLLGGKKGSTQSKPSSTQAKPPSL